MDVEHRITFNTQNAKVLAAWSGLGFKVTAGLNTVVARESLPGWRSVARLVGQTDCAVVSQAIFSPGEIDNASALIVEPAWHHGYPQPGGDFGYLGATYDLREHCPHCGGGLRQHAPFRMRGEPRWGRRNVLQLNWAFDELFVQPDFWRRALEPFGVGVRTVLRQRSFEPLSTVVQLVLDETVRLDMGDWPHEDCPRCGRRKFAPGMTSYMPRPSPVPALARSTELFGSGASSFRRIVCSQAVRRALLAAGASGVTFAPCRS